MKGQTFEILGLVILILAILGVVVLSGTYFSREQGDAIKLLSERQELEGFKAGVNSILYTTEEKSGKTLLELLGIAAYKGKYTIDFGPGAGEVELKRELEDRFDSIYRKGHWYINIPFPNLTSDIQIVAVTDTSASMCNQIELVVKDVPDIISRLREKGKNAEMTLFYFGTPNCCVQEDGRWVKFDINKYPDTQYFHTVRLPKTYKGITCKQPCGSRGSADEDWGSGLKCAIEMGPYKSPGQFEWGENVIKIAIPISDELPGGIECGCPSSGSRRLFERGLNSALENDVTVFGFSGLACGEFHPWRGRRCTTEYFTGRHAVWCTCSKTYVKDWMYEISNKTGGEMYLLENVADATEAIEEIIINAQPNRIPYLEAGTLIPRNKDINAVTIPIPVTALGNYVELKVFYWS